jgi:hypothetical protein
LAFATPKFQILNRLLEDMDLMVDMVNRKLTGVHGDEAVSLVK